MNKTREKLIKKFWSKVNIKSEDECWEWTNHILPTGYGQFRIGDKKFRAHRVSWVISRGSIPKDKLVLHTCDNKKCVNPNHLYIGDHSDNTYDTVLRGTHGRGGTAKFYEGEIWLVRRLNIPAPKYNNQSTKFSAHIVAKMFKTTTQTILNIWNSDSYLCKEGHRI